MRLIHEEDGFEFWAHFDKSAGVWEVFLSDTGGDYIGCCDDLDQAHRHIQDWLADRRTFL